MTSESHVYQLHSTIELPLEEVHELIEQLDFPPGIEDIEITRRNNTLVLSAVAADESLSKYTPTAQLKASISETRVYEEDPEEVRRREGGWSGLDEDPVEEIDSELVEYAGFKGDRETVLQNSTLRYEMFQVLCTIAGEAEKGTLTAITATDGKLQSHQIVDGDERPCSVEVVEGPGGEEEGQSGVDWRDNKFIS